MQVILKKHQDESQLLNKKHQNEMNVKIQEIEALNHKIRTFQIDKMDLMRLEIQNLKVELSS